MLLPAMLYVCPYVNCQNVLYLYELLMFSSLTAHCWQMVLVTWLSVYVLLTSSTGSLPEVWCNFLWNATYWYSWIKLHIWHDGCKSLAGAATVTKEGLSMGQFGWIVKFCSRWKQSDTFHMSKLFADDSWSKKHSLWQDKTAKLGASDLTCSKL